MGCNRRIMLHMSNAPVTTLSPPAPTGPVGERIKRARRYVDLDQVDLVAAMRFFAGNDAPSKRTVSNWENGHTCPDVDHLILIAKATGFPIAWFVAGLDERSDRPDGEPGDEFRSRCSVLIPQVRGQLSLVTAA